MTQIIEDGYGGNNEPSLSIDDLASKAWNDYEVPEELEKLLDELSDTNYFLCGDMFAEGFKAGIAHILTQGKPNE